MMCPACETPLENGYVELEETALDFLAHGLSYLVMVFSGRELTDLDVLTPGRRLRAGVCGRCGAIVITQELWTP
jgi:hypothetical protein